MPVKNVVIIALVSALLASFQACHITEQQKLKAIESARVAGMVQEAEYNKRLECEAVLKTFTTP